MPSILLVLTFLASTTLPFQLIANHIYLRAGVNDNPSSQFLLDTGAGASVIDLAHAAKLHLPLSGSGEAHGSGEKTVPIQLVMRPRIRLGTIEAPLTYLAAISLYDLSLRDGRMMEGIIGYDVFQKYVATIDYAKDIVRFDDPAEFRAPANAVVLPLTFVKKTPVVRGTIKTLDGREFPVRVMVDTGARGGIRLNTPFVKKFNLGDAIGRGVEGRTGIGVGGVTNEKLGRLASVSIAGFALASPVVSISNAKSGTDAETEFDAQIGGEILRRFTLVVDYPNNRLLLTKNAAFNDPFEDDMSGLLLVAVDQKFNRFVVKNVLAGSPAAQAGVNVDDEVLAIDDRPMAATTLNEVRAMFRREGSHKLTIVRGGRKIETTLVARRLV